jgi:hypothetical protein
MCGGPELIMLGGAGVNAISSISAANKSAGEMVRRSIEEEIAAQDHAKDIRRAVTRRVGEARAATAASGVKLDEFSRIITDEIEREGEQDAALTLLTGRRQARSSRRAADDTESAGLFDAAGGLIGAAGSAYGGWRGRKGP